MHLVRRISTRPIFLDGLDLESGCFNSLINTFSGMPCPRPFLGTPSGIVDPLLGSPSTIAKRPPCFKDRVETGVHLAWLCEVVIDQAHVDGVTRLSGKIGC